MAWSNAAVKRERQREIPRMATSVGTPLPTDLHMLVLVALAAHGTADAEEIAGWLEHLDVGAPTAIECQYLRSHGPLLVTSRCERWAL